MNKITAPWLQDDTAQTICRLLVDAGYQVWFVGGCVRNALLGEPVADLDLSTDAHPQTVLDLARAAKIKAIPTGFDHGTVTLVVDDIPFEITTFRRDVATDGRRATVAYSDNITDDARRRDFTINALYADAMGQIADPLGGLPDLKARRIRFIEDAGQRIKEDYLRILRFFRFYAWYGDADAGVDVDGLVACAENIDGLQSLSVERVTSEMLKLLVAPDPSPSVAAMASTGALAQVLPGATHTALAVLVHIEKKTNLAPNAIRRLAVLGGNPADVMRLSKDQIKELDQIKSQMPYPEAAYRLGVTSIMDRLAVEAASLGQEIDPNMARSIKAAASQTFPLKAADFMPALSGPALGKALKAAEARWINSGFTLTKAELLD